MEAKSYRIGCVDYEKLKNIFLNGSLKVVESIKSFNIF